MFRITLVGSHGLQRKRWRSLLGHRRWFERLQGIGTDRVMLDMPGRVPALRRLARQRLLQKCWPYNSKALGPIRRLRLARDQGARMMDHWSYCIIARRSI
jgi:hypothetical protein